MPQWNQREKLITQLFDATIGEAGFESYIGSLCAATNSIAGALDIQSNLRSEAYALVSYGMDANLIAEYEQHYAAVNPYFRPIGDAFQPGFVGNGQMLIDDSTLLRSEYYNDFMKRHDFWQMGGGPLQHDPEATSILTLCGSHRRDIYGAEDLQFIASLMAQMKAALKAMRRMRELRQECALLGEAVERVNFGLAWVDSAGRVLSLNRAARRIVDRRDGLRLEKGMLRQQRGMGLDKAIASAASGPRRRATTLMVSRAATSHGYGLTVVPLRDQDALSGLEHSAALILLTDPEASHPAGIPALVQAFRLSAAEGRLLAFLLDGASTGHAAAQLGVSVPTVRTQTQSLFQKFAVRRQGDLIRKSLLALPPAKHRDES